MHSSIFNSKHPAIFFSKALIGICAVLIASSEVMSNYLVKHHSETYARLSLQYAEALKARHSKPAEPTSVLIVGNSLLLYGVDVDRLRALTSGRMQIYPIFLEATGYYDWLYGLQRLFRDGARPRVVVLGVGINDFFSNSVRRDYAPMMFFDTWDFLDVASDLKVDRTGTTDLLLAHSSVFWDIRGVIRIQVLRHTIPHCRDLFALLTARPAVPPAPEFAAIANSRLQRLRDLCESHGAKLVILVPPTPSSEDAVSQLTVATQKVGVGALVPIDPSVLSVRFYETDGIHLNSEGAVRFTSALAIDLSKTIMAATNRPS